MLELLPRTATIDGGVLSLGGVRADELAEAHGTPLLVYCEETVRTAARAYGAAAPPGTLVVYGTKAFANIGLLRVLAAEGVGADVSTLGELAYARAAGIRGVQIVFHGNNKSDEELRGAAEAGALVVLDSLEEPERAHAAGVLRVLVRLTPGIEAATHTSIRTAHEQSKFGLAADAALATIASAQRLGLDVLGVHVHIGSQLARVDETLLTADRVGQFCLRARDELGWTPQVVDLGGGLGVAHVPDEQPPSVEEWVRAVVAHFRKAWPEPTQLILEPGRSLVGRAGVTLYRVGVVKESGGVAYASIDGGMSDNPRPQLYGARYTALLANRAADTPDGDFRIAGKHCEAGDVLVAGVRLPRPRRGDLLAVPATGAYTLAMGTNYNGVPRPAVVLVAEGRARVIRRRETTDDLLRLEE